MSSFVRYQRNQIYYRRGMLHTARHLFVILSKLQLLMFVSYTQYAYQETRKPFITILSLSTANLVKLLLFTSIARKYLYLYYKINYFISII